MSRADYMKKKRTKLDKEKSQQSGPVGPLDYIEVYLESLTQAFNAKSNNNFFISVSPISQDSKNHKLAVTTTSTSLDQTARSQTYEVSFQLVAEEIPDPDGTNSKELQDCIRAMVFDSNGSMRMKTQAPTCHKGGGLCASVFNVLNFLEKANNQAEAAPALIPRT